MTKTRQAGNKKIGRFDWRKLLSGLFLLVGTLVLTTTMLLWVRSALAAQQSGYQPYLVSSIDFPLPLPSVSTELRATQRPGGELPAPISDASSNGVSSTTEIQIESEGNRPTAEVQPSGTPVATEESGMPQPATTESSEVPSPTMGESNFADLPTPAPSDTAAADPGETTETESTYPPPTEPGTTADTEIPATSMPTAGPVIRLVIPRLQVNRTVVPIELRRDANGHLDWNTDALFSTPNRSDLVGQLAVSSHPGEGGNIILVGHNYNNGWYDWEGVFVRLQNMQVGDEITLFTENGGEFRYIVEKVKKVPWQKRNLVELEKHQKYLWPTDHEQLTLVTCGGVNVWSWQARIYVVALPVNPPSP